MKDMNRHIIRLYATILLLFTALTGRGGEACDSLTATNAVTEAADAATGMDITATEAATEAAVADTTASRPGLIKRVINYFGQSNRRKSNSGLDFSIIGGPYYNSDMGLGIGLVASGLYGANGDPDTPPPSNASLSGKISTKGFATIGLSGTHLAPSDKYRVTYLVEFFADPSDYWGIGYDLGNDNANKSRMKRVGIKIEGAYLRSLGANLYAGPMVAVDYVNAFDIERPDLLAGMSTSTWSVGAGFTLSYDSRDVLTNPHKGVYAKVSQTFRPRFLANKNAFSSTALQLDLYKTIWTRGILAADLRAEFNYGNPSWHMMAQIGGTSFMRGYYQGRYRDKDMMALQVELRQHVWRRCGIVVWGAAATVFRRFDEITMRRMLPNVGMGYRWEFKKDVNVRFDFGFGKSGQNGFMFSINEAF